MKVGHGRTVEAEAEGQRDRRRSGRHVHGGSRRADIDQGRLGTGVHVVGRERRGEGQPRAVEREVRIAGDRIVDRGVEIADVAGRRRAVNERGHDGSAFAGPQRAFQIEREVERPALRRFAAGCLHVPARIDVQHDRGAVEIEVAVAHPVLEDERARKAGRAHECEVAGAVQRQAPLARREHVGDGFRDRDAIDLDDLETAIERDVVVQHVDLGRLARRDVEHVGHRIDRVVGIVEGDVERHRSGNGSRDRDVAIGGELDRLGGHLEAVTVLLAVVRAFHRQRADVGKRQHEETVVDPVREVDRAGRAVDEERQAVGLLDVRDADLADHLGAVRVAQFDAHRTAEVCHAVHRCDGRFQHEERLVRHRVDLDRHLLRGLHVGAVLFRRAGNDPEGQVRVGILEREHAQGGKVPVGHVDRVLLAEVLVRVEAVGIAGCVLNDDTVRQSRDDHAERFGRVDRGGRDVEHRSRCIFQGGSARQRQRERRQVRLGRHVEDQRRFDRAPRPVRDRHREGLGARYVRAWLIVERAVGQQVERRACRRGVGLAERDRVAVRIQHLRDRQRVAARVGNLRQETGRCVARQAAILGHRFHDGRGGDRVRVVHERDGRGGRGCLVHAVGEGREDGARASVQRGIRRVGTEHDGAQEVFVVALQRAFDVVLRRDPQHGVRTGIVQGDDELQIARERRVVDQPIAGARVLQCHRRAVEPRVVDVEDRQVGVDDANPRLRVAAAAVRVHVVDGEVDAGRRAVRVDHARRGGRAGREREVAVAVQPEQRRRFARVVGHDQAAGVVPVETGLVPVARGIGGRAAEHRQGVLVAVHEGDELGRRVERVGRQVRQIDAHARAGVRRRAGAEQTVDGQVDRSQCRRAQAVGVVHVPGDRRGTGGGKPGVRIDRPDIVDRDAQVVAFGREGDRHVSGEADELTDEIEGLRRPAAFRRQGHRIAVAHDGVERAEGVALGVRHFGSTHDGDGILVRQNARKAFDPQGPRFDRTDGKFEVPVPAERGIAGQVDARRHVGPGRRGEHRRGALPIGTCAEIAAVHHDVAGGRKGVAHRGERSCRRHVGRACVENGTAEPQRAGRAVGHDVQRVDAVRFLEDLRHEQHAVGIRIDHMHFGRRIDAGEQGVEVRQLAVDEDEFTQVRARVGGGRRIVIGILAHDEIEPLESRRAVDGERGAFPDRARLRFGRQVGLGQIGMDGLRRDIERGFQRRGIEQDARLQHPHQRRFPLRQHDTPPTRENGPDLRHMRPPRHVRDPRRTNAVPRMDRGRSW